LVGQPHIYEERPEVLFECPRWGVFFIVHKFEVADLVGKTISCGDAFYLFIRSIRFSWALPIFKLFIEFIKVLTDEPNVLNVRLVGDKLNCYYLLTIVIKELVQIGLQRVA
jgi:hypothetical protein